MLEGLYAEFETRLGHMALLFQKATIGRWDGSVSKALSTKPDECGFKPCDLHDED